MQIKLLLLLLLVDGESRQGMDALPKAVYSMSPAKAGFNLRHTILELSFHSSTLYCL